MREHFNLDWVASITSHFTKQVEKSHPGLLRNWPNLSNNSSKAYFIGNEFIVYIFVDKLSGIPTVESLHPKAFPYTDMPLKPCINNIIEWLSYIDKKFSLRQQDFSIIIPNKDSNKNIEEDVKLWSDDDMILWNVQSSIIMDRHFYYLKGVNVMKDFYLPDGYQFLKNESASFFKDNPDYDKNIFIMTRFVPGNKVLEKLDTEIRRVLKAHGYNPLRADDKMYMPDRNLWNNVCLYMLCCKYGIAILEDRIVDEFNPNVALEYGFMRALNKQALLLSDCGFRNLRADIIGTLRESFDLLDIEGTIRKPIETWLGEL